MTWPTQGPWRSDYDDNGFYFVTADNAPSPYIVATGGEGDEAEANARLIAAAPDMVEALKILQLNLSLHGRPSEGELNEMHRIASVAIRKATGAA